LITSGDAAPLLSAGLTTFGALAPDPIEGRAVWFVPVTPNKIAQKIFPRRLGLVDGACADRFG